ncbi:MAG: hypothetical protein PHW46_03300 [Candidatus Omnitrophica bacterium]|nr:hypothetical protein [Candidatus Omnitrophota bacterium]
MPDKTDFEKLVEKYQPIVKKTGERLAETIKAAEKDVERMYKIAHSHIEIQMKNLEKEKLYHEMGKYVARRLFEGGLDVQELEKFKIRLAEIDVENEKIKKKLVQVKNSGKRK